MKVIKRRDVFAEITLVLDKLREHEDKMLEEYEALASEYHTVEKIIITEHERRNLMDNPVFTTVFMEEILAGEEFFTKAPDIGSQLDYGGIILELGRE